MLTQIWYSRKKEEIQQIDNFNLIFINFLINEVI